MLTPIIEAKLLDEPADQVAERSLRHPGHALDLNGRAVTRKAYTVSHGQTGIFGQHFRKAGASPRPPSERPDRTAPR
jgi:hypothetical protein